MTGKRLIYMDHAATTPARKEVTEAMLPYMATHFGNPSSLYTIASDSRAAVDEAREKVAGALNADTSEIFFTSGGTESDNWAIKGVAFANRNKGTHIITSQIEHHAVLHTCEWLEKVGFSVTYLPVDRYGRVNPAELEDAIREETILISIMYANNEIGTIQPVKEIGELAAGHGIPFHCDAVQAVGHIPIDLTKMNIDLLSLSGHKLYGPKGTGALYIRKGIRIDPLMHGGAQEKRKRAGTENVPGIVGLGRAIELAVSELPKSSKRISGLRDRLIEGLTEIPCTMLNGHPVERLPNNVNVGFEFIEGESILLMLNSKGICASTGSACTSSSLEPSHVLTACGIPPEKAHGSLRLTLGDGNSDKDVDYVLETLPGIVKRLREISPLTPKELLGGDNV